MESREFEILDQPRKVKLPILAILLLAYYLISTFTIQVSGIIISKNFSFLSLITFGMMFLALALAVLLVIKKNNLLAGIPLALMVCAEALYVLVVFIKYIKVLRSIPKYSYYADTRLTLTISSLITIAVILLFCLAVLFIAAFIAAKSLGKLEKFQKLLLICGICAGALYIVASFLIGFISLVGVFSDLIDVYENFFYYLRRYSVTTAFRRAFTSTYATNVLLDWMGAMHNMYGATTLMGGILLTGLWINKPYKKVKA